MIIGQSFRKSAAWLFAGSTGIQFLSFLFGIVLARLLVPADFGMLLTIQIFTGFASLISGGGMGQALIRAKTATEEDYSIVFTLQCIIGCVIYSAFFFAAPWFAQWYSNPIYTDLLRVSALSFVYRPLVNLPGSILNRQMRFKAATIIGVIAMLVSSGVSVGLAYFAYGVWSLIWGGIAGAAVNVALLLYITQWRPKISGDFRRGREIARYGLLFSTNDVVFYLRSQVSIFILSRTLGAASVGLFNKGETLARMPHRFITGSVYPVLFRSLAAEQDRPAESRYLFFRSIALIGVYATPLYVGLLWLAEPLIRGVYGSKWVEAAGPLAILSLAWPFWLMGNLSGNVLGARDWLDRELLVQVTTLIYTIAAVIVGHNYGINGVAWAVVSSAAFSGLWQYWLAVRCLGAKLSGYPLALFPAVILNILLATWLYVLDSFIPESIKENDLVYIATMGIPACGVYVFCFLFLPFAALKSEQQRWKVILRLAPGTPTGNLD